MNPPLRQLGWRPVRFHREVDAPHYEPRRFLVSVSEERPGRWYWFVYALFSPNDTPKVSPPSKVYATSERAREVADDWIRWFLTRTPETWIEPAEGSQPTTHG